jgi:hypothetical protein
VPRDRLPSRLLRRAVALGVLLLAMGCDGSDEAASPTPPAAPAAVVTIPCSLGSTMAEIEHKLFQSAKCAVCHGRLPGVPTSLDLVSDGLAGRLVDRPAEPSPARGRCAGRILVPSNDPTGGLLVEKVERRPTSCGVTMPDGLPRLTADEISCVKRWATLAAASR